MPIHGGRPGEDERFNHAMQLAMSTAASAGKLFGLSIGQIANAISIATADNISLACIHAEPVAQWKGFSPGWTGMRAVYATSMAKRGFTGPRGLFEGPKGLEQMFGGPIQVDWDDPSLNFVKQTVLKKYCSLIHGQPVIEATMDLRRRYNLVAAEVEHVRCDTFQAGYDFAGGGNYGSKDHPWHKEQGDYNLKYLISAALLEGQVGPAQLTDERVQAPDAQAMVARIECRPDAQFTARFPQELGARITVHTKDGRELVVDWLSEAYADGQLRSRIIGAVQEIDSRPISHLMDLLGQVRPSADYPITHPGI
jgi:2-methylcitrate dehydratase